MIGRVLSNRYEILERVGGGGMALVYRSRDLLLNRTVAVKVLSPQFTTDEDFVRKFKREAQAAASLSNPNIVSIFDVGQDDDVYYIVMEFIEGKSLKEVITENEALPVSTALQITRQIAEALRAAHKHGVIHRDIKPHNIMITPDGHVKVTDFGIARAVTSSTLTNTGSMIGSVHYISPEQARGGFTGERSDIYSLGVVLYEMLTGQVPFSGESLFSIAIKHLQEPMQSPRELDPRIPPEVERIVLRATAKDQASRYQSADDLIHDLQSVLRDTGKKDSLHELVGKRRPAGKVADNDLEQTYVPLPRRGERAPVEGERARSAPKGEERTTPQEKPPKQRSALFYATIVLVIAALLGGAMLAWVFWPQAVVEVPDLQGQSLAEAQRRLNEARLSLGPVSEVWSEQDATTVISQDPPAGREVRPGRAVAVTISRGPEYAEVPNVIGWPLREAELELANAGLQRGPINRQYSDEPVDTVIDQSPAAGARIRRDTEVVLTVSAGPEPVPIAMPRLIGLDLAAAQSRLNQNELALGTTNGPVGDGVVVQQSPEPGEQVLPGQAVNLLFGPAVVRVIFEYEVPSTIASPHQQIEIIKEDVQGSELVYSERVRRGETVTLTITGSGRMRVIVRANGQVVREEVYP